MSNLQAVPMFRSRGDGKPPCVSFDFEIDGASLATLLDIEQHQLVGRFNATHPEWNQHPRLEYLLRGTPKVAEQRVLLFGCECGDIGCGGITMTVRREGNIYEWSDFRFENGYDPAVTREFPGVGPYRFLVSDYKRVLESLGEQNEA